MKHLPNLVEDALDVPTIDKLFAKEHSAHNPQSYPHFRSNRLSLRKP